MKKMFKIFMVLKLVGIIMLCASCGTTVNSTSVAEVEGTLPMAQAAEQISTVAEVTEKPTTTTTTTIKKKNKTTTTTTTKKEKEREYVVYKPSTHYIHKSTCSWVTDECYEIESTKDLEVLVCGDCNPDMLVEKYYEPPVETTTTTTVTTELEPEETVTTTTAPTIEKIGTDDSTIYKPNEYLTNVYIDEYSRQLLAEIVYHEYGADWVPIEEQARIASGVMNRVYDDRFPSTVYDVLTAPGQFSGYWPGCCTPTQQCYDAVDYYFANQGDFDGCNSWTGDGTWNHFYFQ